MGLLLIAIAWTWFQGTVTKPITMVFHAGSPAYSVQDLRREASGIYLLLIDGDPFVHWNAEDNRPWGEQVLGKRAHIYRDQPFKVVETIAGPELTSITLRGVGGQLNGYNLIYEDEPEFDLDVIYLAFVYEAETPTKEGIETAMAIVLQDRGLFTLNKDGSWSNSVGTTIMDLERLR